MTPYQLRKANDHDRDRIAEIWHSSASLPDVGPPQMPSYDHLRARVDDELAAGWAVTVAQGEDGLIGFVAIKPAQRYLAELFVVPTPFAVRDRQGPAGRGQARHGGRLHAIHHLREDPRAAFL